MYIFLFEHRFSVLLGILSRSGIAGSYGEVMFHFFEQLSALYQVVGILA